MRSQQSCGGAIDKEAPEAASSRRRITRGHPGPRSQEKENHWKVSTMQLHICITTLRWSCRSQDDKMPTGSSQKGQTGSGDASEGSSGTKGKQAQGRRGGGPAPCGRGRGCGTTAIGCKVAIGSATGSVGSKGGASAQRGKGASRGSAGCRQAVPSGSS